MKKLYVITGRNGVGLVSTYPDVENKRRYFVACNCKSFTLYREAEEYALQHLREIAPLNSIIPRQININQLIFVKNLERTQCEIPENLEHCSYIL